MHECARLDGMQHVGRACASFRAQWLTRRALSAVRPGTEPGAWLIDRLPSGKPVIRNADGAAPLFCNWSHTDRLVACVVTDAGDTGIDVECPDAQRDWNRFLERFFTPAERERLTGETGGTTALVRAWTLKEAAVKARGGGMLRDAQTFSVQPKKPGEWFTVSDTLEAHTPIRLAELPLPGWIGAAAVVSDSSVPLRIECRRWSDAELLSV